MCIWTNTKWHEGSLFEVIFRQCWICPVEVADETSIVFRSHAFGSLYCIIVWFAWDQVTTSWPHKINIFKEELNLMYKPSVWCNCSLFCIFYSYISITDLNNGNILFKFQIVPYPCPAGQVRGWLWGRLWSIPPVWPSHLCRNRSLPSFPSVSEGTHTS